MAQQPVRIDLPVKLDDNAVALIVRNGGVRIDGKPVTVHGVRRNEHMAHFSRPNDWVYTMIEGTVEV